MTGNASEKFYPLIGYDEMLRRYQNTPGAFIGPTDQQKARNRRTGSGLFSVYHKPFRQQIPIV